MSRKLSNLDGFENDLVKVLRLAVGDESPTSGTDKYWMVQCKACGKIRAQRARRIKLRQGCPGCRGLKLSACRDEKLRKDAASAWGNIQAAVTDCNLDAIEEAVKLLRRFEMMMARESK